MSYQEKDSNAEVQEKVLLFSIRASINQPPKSVIESRLRGIEQTVLPVGLRQAQEAFDDLVKTAKEKTHSDNALRLTVDILEAIEKRNESDLITLPWTGAGPNHLCNSLRYEFRNGIDI